MGCNESKQAVATTNAISRRSFRRKSSSVKPKDADATTNNNLETVPTIDQPAEQADDQLNNIDQNNVAEVKNVNATTETTTETDLNNKIEDGGVIVGGGHHTSVSLSSRDDFFSTRKDDDPTESEDGYYSPTRDPVKDGELRGEGERNEGDQKEEVKDEPEVQEEKSLAENENTTSPVKEDEKEKVEDLKEPDLTKVVEEITVEPSEAPVVVIGTASDMATAATETATATATPATVTPDESSNLTGSEELSSDSPVKEAEAE